MRLFLISVLVAALTTVAVIAQTNQSGMTPAKRPHSVSRPMQPFRTGPVPRLYTLKERAMAFKKITKSQVPPSLGQQISLTPNQPFASGLAQFNFTGATVFSGNITLGPPASGVAWISNLQVDNANVQVALKARGGMRYLFDCRAFANNNSINYVDIANGRTVSSGQVSIGSDSHFLFVIDALSSDMLSTVTMSDPGASVPWVIWGCEVTPV